MIDKASISVSSGNGGAGIVSGRREKYVSMGGPDGGHGGDGGSIYLATDPNTSTLMSFRYRKRFHAGDGGNGRGGLKHGANGDDVEIRVPVGTEVRLAGDLPRILSDLSEPGLRIEVARGGRGGRGNSAFTSSVNRFPLLAEEGEPGEELELVLELKLLADIGIIGAPNAGKSSLLTSVSAARPKVASYPFTTLEPVLGVVEWRGDSFVMVDVPGLVEGAHLGVGLGHEFLRHVERTRVLVHVVDGALDDPMDQIRQTNEELRMHLESLAERPQVVAVNKIDLPEAEAQRETLAQELTRANTPHVFISAATGEGVGGLLDVALEQLRQQRARLQAEQPIEELPVLRPKPRVEEVVVTRENDAYIVSSLSASRVVSMIDENDWNARIQVYSYLKRIGVVKALESAGVSPGDTVVIGKVVWEWQ